LKQSNRLQLHSLSSSSAINWSKYKSKSYLHFDNRINIEHVKTQIQNPQWVESHAFLPSIHFEIKFNKYVLKDKVDINIKDNKSPKELKEKKEKIRKIFYASHIDRFIYKYYGELLNNAYNLYTCKHQIDEISLAYRNNKEGLNNIDFAHEVFDFLLLQDQAVIIALDFSSFFDNINHRTLKENLKTVLGCNELPNDFFKVYKNLTEFTYVHKNNVENFLKSKYGEKQLNKLLKEKMLPKIMDSIEFREFKKENLLKNKKPYGIPQGSGMSAVCSNIHLIHFDQELKNWADSKNALYRRYCDDLILILPVKNSCHSLVAMLEEEVYQIIKKYRKDGLLIQKEKTEVRIYQNDLIINKQGEKSKLDYLGFVTDGKTIKIREKSLFKYYCRAYRKVDVCRRITFVTGEKFERKKLYKIYTHLGYRYKKHGNFISYANKAHKKMSTLKAKSLIKNQVKRHWSKIQKRINA